MRCPFCSNQDSQVKDSRPTEDNTAIRRRRICDQCGSRFTTFERIQLRDLIVLKTNGKKEVFDRDKMFRSLSLALRKRNIDQEKIEEKIRFAQRNNVLIKDNFRSDLIYKEISDLLLPRLVIKELSIDNKLFEVTLKTFTTDDIFMCDVPDGLVPNRSLHFKHLL